MVGWQPLGPSWLRLPFDVQHLQELQHVDQQCPDEGHQVHFWRQNKVAFAQIIFDTFKGNTQCKSCSLKYAKEFQQK